MDGKRFNPDSNYMHMLRKCGRGVHGGIGIGMSELPDEIIVVILSFLSLREAAATSVLSSRWLNLWKHTPNLKFDRISQLPDSIIIRILSILPLKTAVATSIISSRWSDKWKHTANLDFLAWNLNFNLGSQMEMLGFEMEGDLWDAERCKYTELVNSVIQLHKGPSVKRFYLSFYVNKSAHLQVAKWLQFVEDLNLGFQCFDPEYKVVLEELLREISGLCSPQTLICFKSLKTLCLNSCRVSGEAMDVFLRNCPLLENLIIAYSCVEVCGTSASANPLMLKHLEVNGCNGSSVKVSAPNLTRLEFEDTTRELFLENVPRLVEADFTFRSRSLDVVRNVASAMLCFSSQLKILNLTLRHPKVFLMNGFPEMPNLRKLVVEYDGVSTHSLLPVATALICSSPRLQEFKLMFMNKMDNHNGDAAIQVGRNGERCDPIPHLHLKLFELAGFVRGAAHHIQLLTYIVDNCVALEKIIIDTILLTAFSVRIPLIVVHPSLSEILNEREMEKQFLIDYVKQELQAKLPQHIQLEFV